MMAYCACMKTCWTHDDKLCMHDGMLDPENAIDMLGMLCTLNLTKFIPHINLVHIKFDTIHSPYRNVLGNWLVSGFGPVW